MIDGKIINYTSLVKIPIICDDTGSFSFLLRQS